jgi:signal transduction histidine kinase
VRRRLTIAIVAVAAGSVALFAFPLGIVLRDGYRDQELLRLQRDTVAAARLIDLGTSVDDRVELPRGSDLVAVYDAAGRRVAGPQANGPARADAVVRDTINSRRPATRTGPGTLIAAVPLLTGERVNGAIRAQRSDHVVAGRAHGAWLALAAAAAGVVLLALVAAILLGRRLARPLEEVAVAARRLGDGDFSVRAPRGRVAEVDAVAEAIDATAARLDDLITRERAFSADASHQLRTPLAALRLELEAHQLSAGAAGDLDAAVEQVDRVERTVATLLAVARDTSRPEATCDVGQILDGAQARWYGRLAAEGRRLSVRSPPRALDVRASPAVVSEILEVLLDNALRHGAGTVTVAVRTLDDEWVGIELSDEGEGFPAPTAAAFDRRITRNDGHGIGLALARSLAHAEGGRLSLISHGPSPVVMLTLRRVAAIAESRPD